MEFFTEEFFRQAYYKHCFDTFATAYYRSVQISIQNPLVRLQYSVTRGLTLTAAVDIISGAIIQSELVPLQLEPTDLPEFKELTAKFAHQITDDSIIILPGIPMLLKRSTDGNCTYVDNKLVALKDISAGDTLSITSDYLIYYTIKSLNPISKDFIKFVEDLVQQLGIEVKYFSVKYKLAEHRYADSVEDLDKTFEVVEARYNREKKSLELELDKAEAMVDSIKAKLSKLKSNFSEDKEVYLNRKESIKLSDSNSKL